jgi:uncharacterized protein
MLIRVSEIPEEGIQIEGADALPHPFEDPTWTLEELSLAVEKEGETVFVRGALAARVPLVCGRCLEPFVLRIAPSVDARFVPSPRGRAEEHELAAEDLETDTYANDILDIGALVVTETTLGVPMKPLCGQDCRGLCPVCGGNRNVVPCTCQVRESDPRWAPLKGLADRLSR